MSRAALASRPSERMSYARRETPIQPDPDVLYRLYWQERRPIGEICAKLRLTPTVLLSYADRYGIPRRPVLTAGSGPSGNWLAQGDLVDLWSGGHTLGCVAQTAKLAKRQVRARLAASGRTAEGSESGGRHARRRWFCRAGAPGHTG